MAKGVNKVILVATCGKDPEIRYAQSGVAFANLSVATSESWKDKNTGEQKEHTEWHKLVFSGRLAEIVGEYVKKGSKIYIEGKLATRKWQGQDGKDVYTTEVKCFTMQMLDSKGSGQQQPAQQQAPQNYQQPQQQAPMQQAPQQRPQNNQPESSNYAQVPHAQQAQQQAPAMDDFSDDIPF